MGSTRGWVQLTALVTCAACSFSSESGPSDNEQTPDAGMVADDERVNCNALCAHLTAFCLSLGRPAAHRSVRRPPISSAAVRVILLRDFLYEELRGQLVPGAV